MISGKNKFNKQTLLNAKQTNKIKK